MYSNDEFQIFSDALIHQLAAMFPPDTHICTQLIPKNNDIYLNALIIRQPGINISPTIYLDDYYQLFLEGTPIDELCEIICDVFFEVRLNHPMDAKIFTDFAQAKKRLVFQVINYDKNKERLTDLVYFRYLDLAIIFCCMLRLETGDTASVTVKNDLLHMWQTDAETVKKQAFYNTPRLLPAYIQPLVNVLRDLAEDHPVLKDLLPTASTCEHVPALYVLTNETQNGGAACMLYPSLLAEFADSVGSDLYILPSSVHELLLLPTDKRDCDDALNELVRQVNHDQLAPSQLLADHVYFYCRSSASVVS